MFSLHFVCKLQTFQGLLFSGIWVVQHNGAWSFQDITLTTGRLGVACTVLLVLVTASSGLGIVLVLCAGECQMIEAGLSNWYFCEFFIPILSYTMFKNNIVISPHFPILKCRQKEHTGNWVCMQRHNMRNIKGPVCTVPDCLCDCGLLWLLLKVCFHLLLLRHTCSSSGFHPYARATMLPRDRWEIWTL